MTSSGSAANPCKSRHFSKCACFRRIKESLHSRTLESFLIHDPLVCCPLAACSARQSTEIQSSTPSPPSDFPEDPYDCAKLSISPPFAHAAFAKRSEPSPSSSNVSTPLASKGLLHPARDLMRLLWSPSLGNSGCLMEPQPQASGANPLL
jgi:hypothetical protein